MLAREHSAQGDSDAVSIDRKARRFRRPSTVWGWLVWLLIALLFFLMISYVLVPWWYQPVPSDIPPDIPRVRQAASLSESPV
jgi:hypothetical protein